MRNAQYGNHLRTIGAARDQMHIRGTGTVGIYREIVWKTQPVDDTYHNKRAKMEAWLDKFFDCTGSTTNWMKKKTYLGPYFATLPCPKKRHQSLFSTLGLQKGYGRRCPSLLWVDLRATAADCRKCMCRRALPRHTCGMWSPRLLMTFLLGSQCKGTHMVLHVATTIGTARCQVLAAGWVMV